MIRVPPPVDPGERRSAPFPPCICQIVTGGEPPATSGNQRSMNSGGIVNGACPGRFPIAVHQPLVQPLGGEPIRALFVEPAGNQHEPAPHAEQAPELHTIAVGRLAQPEHLRCFAANQVAGERDRQVAQAGGQQLFEEFQERRRQRASCLGRAALVCPDRVIQLLRLLVIGRQQFLANPHQEANDVPAMDVGVLLGRRHPHAKLHVAAYGDVRERQQRKGEIFLVDRAAELPPQLGVGRIRGRGWIVFDHVPDDGCITRTFWVECTPVPTRPSPTRPPGHMTLMIIWAVSRIRRAGSI